jgi:hypothetical protein
LADWDKVVFTMQNISQRLSAEAINYLRKIYEEEFNEVLNQDQAEEMGLRLLRFFSILVKEKDAGIELTDHEFVALRHIHNCLCHYKRQPSVRSITEAIGCHSPRSGLQVLGMLMKRQVAWRNEKGEICMVEGHCDFWECGK